MSKGTDYDWRIGFIAGLSIGWLSFAIGMLILEVLL